MIRRLDLRGLAADQTPDYAAVVPRAPFDVSAAVDVVRPVCEDVRRRGLEAVAAYTEQFDGVELADPVVPPDVMQRCLDDLDPQVRAALEESAARLRRSSRAELESETTSTVAPGATVRRRIVPIPRVGLYVPGGLAPLVSSVVMNVVPAQVAGVGSIALASPPQKDFGGLPHPTILAACALLGVDEVYAAGGAQAVAMLAYGAGGCRPVDLVTGPGNIYVTAAKRYVSGTVAIDSEAGPTEIMVLADDSADPDLVAADLVSQAEHDPLAGSVLVTDSEALADAVVAGLEREVPRARHAARITHALGAEQSSIVLVDDMEQGLALADAYAAEHLEVQTRDAEALAARVRNAGAVFVGTWTPVSLGDYCAGSNHVLPTAGAARHSSGLSVRAFTRTMQVVTYDRAALEAVADQVVALAEAEDLPSHGRAVSARFGVRETAEPTP